MKAADFHYERPGSLDAALALLAQSDRDPALLAGGQSLMPMMNFRLAQPGLLIDLGRIPGLAGIAETDTHVRIGAMTRYADLGPALAHLPLLAKALPHIAHPAIRNRGTVGGSLALADPAAELPAVALALGATLHAHGPDGPAQIAADDFFLGAYDTALPEAAILTAVSFPRAAASDRFGFHEIARRHGDYAMAGAAIARTAAGHRVALFAVADRALRAPMAEAALDAGAVPGPSALDALPFEGDLNGAPATKHHLASVAVARALKDMEP